MVDQRIVRMLPPQTRCHQPPQTRSPLRRAATSPLRRAATSPLRRAAPSGALLPAPSDALPPAPSDALPPAPSDTLPPQTRCPLRRAATSPLRHAAPSDTLPPQTRCPLRRAAPSDALPPAPSDALPPQTRCPLRRAATSPLRQSTASVHPTPAMGVFGAMEKTSPNPSTHPCNIFFRPANRGQDTTKCSNVSAIKQNGQRPLVPGLLKLFLPPRARRQPLLCANSLHLSHSSSPHLSCYIISHPFTCFQMFPSHTHCTLYSPCFISHDIHPYFLRSPRGPGGCNSSPRDTGFRGRGPSHPGLGGPGLGGPGLGCPVGRPRARRPRARLPRARRPRARRPRARRPRARPHPAERRAVSVDMQHSNSAEITGKLTKTLQLPFQRLIRDERRNARHSDPRGRCRQRPRPLCSCGKHRRSYMTDLIPHSQQHLLHCACGLSHQPHSVSQRHRRRPEGRHPRREEDEMRQDETRQDKTR
ncbi:hypothetical protein NQZ68_028610 [Dissostichus eleginoides]|nr:hypothetical protein NQZ68_028610 [Dissostichus eleginoides]